MQRYLMETIKICAYAYSAIENTSPTKTKKTPQHKKPPQKPRKKYKSHQCSIRVIHLP